MSDVRMQRPEEQEQIVIPDESGEEHLFEVLFSFDVDSTGSSYIVLAPAGAYETDDEEIEVHAFKYEEPEGEDIALFPIESEEEWEMVEELLNTFTADEDEVE
ncbi:DUF1292 domain-containing protein [Alteribacter aurantiacus]|uniref:DUF1292 domain-containing protein n=1 Tax=Alteribacter aurantiacus TaxID=254410 RepID=UPI00040F6B94|nr:DUF1292 domain-containing protein [Alteribacter aurantiacus]